MSGIRPEANADISPAPNERSGVGSPYWRRDLKTAVFFGRRFQEIFERHVPIPDLTEIPSSKSKGEKEISSFQEKTQFYMLIYSATSSIHRIPLPFLELFINM